MKKHIICILLLFILVKAYPWGQNGHRVVGKIAESYLTNKAKKNIEDILGHLTLAEVSTFMDEIKSNPRYNHMNPWHYCTIPDDKTYEEAGRPEEGDAIQTIDRLIKELKTKEFTDEDEAFALKCLVHLIGDIHQPLHVGNGNDRGGNDIKLEYFREPSNLHRVWDTGMIEAQNMSYTEYTEWINHPTDEQMEKWVNSSLMDWIYESKSYRDQVYDLPDNMKISYEYNYRNIDLVNQRLLQAGIRLAKVLNEIYG